jgi:hypothetical protein
MYLTLKKQQETNKQTNKQTNLVVQAVRALRREMR